MGVPCPGCGREYDVALFAFGRTIHCTCGRRVAVTPRIRRAEVAGPIRFFADAMLGRLARWLRILGFDVAFEAHIADGELVRRAVQEGRIVLTRDRRLPEEWRVEGVHVVVADHTHEQLQEVVRVFGLAHAFRPFTRCTRCNGPLVDASPAEVRGRVPPRVWAAQEHFRRCAECDHLFWSGSHARRIERVIERLRAEDPAH